MLQISDGTLHMFVDMAGKTNYEMGLVDQYMELTAELFYDMRSVFLEKDEEKRVSTRGVQYVMKTAQYIPKFYIYTLHYHFH